MSVANRHNVVLKPNPRTVGILGGRGGKMGMLFADLFKESGHRVITTGPRAGEHIAPRAMRHLNRKLLRAADVVILAVPIPEVEKGLTHLFGPGALRGLRGKLIFDICSTKSQPMHAMAAAGGASVIGTHPFFGPAIQQIKGKNVILCPLHRASRVLDLNTQAWASWLQTWWARQGAAVHFMTPDEHDLVAALIQVGPLAVVSVFAEAILSTGIPLSMLEQIFTPNSLVLQTVMGRMLNPSMIETYANLAAGNKFAPRITMAIRDAAEALHLDTIAMNAAGIGMRLSELAATITPEFRTRAMDLSKKFEAAAAAG